MQDGGQNFVPLLKLNQQGDSVWLKQFIYTNVNAMWGIKVLQNGDGGYTLLSNAVDSTNYQWKTMLTRTDANGNELWTKNYINDQGTSPCSFLITPDDGCIIATYTNPSINDNDLYLIRTDAQGDTLWTKTIPHPSGYSYLLHRSNCINQTSDGKYLITGSKVNISNIQDSRVLVIKTDTLGNHLGTYEIENAPLGIGGSSVFETTDGNYFIVGGLITDTTSTDAVVIKCDTAANVIWSKTFGGASPDGITYAFLTSDGGIAGCGMETSWGDGGGVYLIKTDSLGNAQSFINGIFPQMAGNTSSITIYPNPLTTSAVVSVRTLQRSGGAFTVYTATGLAVQTYEVTTASFTVHREMLPPGLYLGVHTPSDGSRSSHIKFIVH